MITYASQSYQRGLITLSKKNDGNLRLRPLLPSSAGPLVGCLLLHITARSYGASQTHRLCRTPLLVILADTSSAFLPSQLSLGSPTPPKDLLRRTYLYIHSPIIVCAMASTTLVGCTDVVAFESCRSWANGRVIEGRCIDRLSTAILSRGAVMSSNGSGGY